LEAILRKRSNAPKGTVNFENISKAEKTAYDSEKKRASRERKKIETGYTNGFSRAKPAAQGD
jgi:hypothetical protein